MKIALNILIGLLIIFIWSDFERNSVSEKLDYSVSILSSLGLIAVTILRIYHRQFAEFLTKPS